MFIVYQITNTINGHYYRGKTSKKYWDQGYMGSGDAIHNAYDKYGKENFVRKILSVWSDEAEAYAEEARVVVTFKEDPTSYNITPGGLGVGSGEQHPSHGKPSPLRGRKCPEISERMKGKGNQMYGRTGVNCPAYGKPNYHAKNRVGKNHPLYGKEVSAKTRALISKNHSRHNLGKKLSPEHCKKISESRKLLFAKRRAEKELRESSLINAQKGATNHEKTHNKHNHDSRTIADVYGSFISLCGN